MNTSKPIASLSFFAIFFSFWGGSTTALCQYDKEVSKRTLVVTTNVPHSKLIRLEDGILLATANERGVIQWIPNEITKADCRLAVQAEYHLPETVQPKRKLRKSLPFLNAVGTSILAGSLFGLSIESTEGEPLTVAQVAVGSSSGILAFGLGALDSRNYVWKASSRNFTVNLIHTPEYLNKVWSEVTASESISRIEEFQRDYPEFDRQSEIEMELGRLMYRDILEGIAVTGERALKTPEMLGSFTESIRTSIDDLSEWGNRFSTIEAQPFSIQQDQLSTILGLIESTFEASTSDWASMIPSLEGNSALPYALAGFLSTWSMSDSPMEALRQTAHWPERARSALVTAPSTAEIIASYALLDWQSKVTWNETEINASALKSHLTLWRETLVEMGAGLDLTELALSSDFEQLWSNELSSWSRPADLECLLASKIMTEWIQLNEAEANEELELWHGLVLPNEVTLEDVFKNCDSCGELLPGGALIPLDLLDAAGLMPDKYKAHLAWSSAFGDGLASAPQWVLLPSEDDAIPRYTYTLADGREWRISTLIEDPKEPGSAWNGTYSGVQPSYAMKNAQGEDMVINGNKIVIPQCRYVFNLEDFDISISQKPMDGSSSVVEYAGKCRLIKSGDDSLIMDCSLADVGGGSTPNVTLEIFLTSGNAKVTGNLGPEFEIINSSVQGVDNALLVECFSIYDASKNPQILMLSRPHFAGDTISDIQFMPPISLITSSKGVIYPSRVDSIKSNINALMNHPGLSTNQLSSGRSDQFYDVQREADEIQENLEVLQVYATQELLPSNVSWSTLGELSAELNAVRKKLEELDVKLTEKERKLAEYEKSIPKMSAEDLDYEYQTNSLRAGDQFDNKIVEIVGFVSEVSPDGRRGLQVDVEAWYLPVECSFSLTEENKTRAMYLNSGDYVKIRGKCLGLNVGSVKMTDCVFKN